MAKRTVWLDQRDVLAIHAEQIAEHGGKSGLRDEPMLDSALARPRNRELYARASIFELAAAYAFGLARNHPFIDGNKRVALVSSFAFLELNGWEVNAAEEDAVVMFLSLAAGEVDEPALAKWLEQYSIRQAP